MRIATLSSVTPLKVIAVSWYSSSSGLSRMSCQFSSVIVIESVLTAVGVKAVATVFSLLGVGVKNA